MKIQKSIYFEPENLKILEAEAQRRDIPLTAFIKFLVFENLSKHLGASQKI